MCGCEQDQVFVLKIGQRLHDLVPDAGFCPKFRIKMVHAGLQPVVLS